MVIVVTLVVAAYSLPPANLNEIGPSVLRSGMGQLEVERLVGEPPFGFEHWGDRTAGRMTALYRRPGLRAVHYVNNKVVRVDPPQVAHGEWVQGPSRSSSTVSDSVARP